MRNVVLFKVLRYCIHYPKLECKFSFFATFSYYAHISISGTVGHTGALERQGSIQGRERMIAHSTALESITVEVDSMSVAGIGAGASGVSATNTSQQVIEDELIDDATGKGLVLIKIWQFFSRIF